MTDASITFYGGVQAVTGANFLFEVNGVRILVDCGLEQGSPEAEERNRADFSYDPALIDYLFITHAHLDHIGRVPKLVRDGYEGPIYSTPVTRRISEIMFDDAIGIMEHEKKEEDKPMLYERRDADQTISQWNDLTYYEDMELESDVRVRFKDAGHILGSAMIEFIVPGSDGEERKVIFTGDLGNSPAPLLRDTDPIEEADYMVMESVYGDRNHESPEDRDEAFQECVTETIERGGTLVIPAFSLERTQIILHQLNHMIEEGTIPSVPVYLDSPLAIKVTRIFEEITKHYNDHIKEEAEQGEQLFSFPSLQMTERVEQSKAIEEVEPPKIIIAGSGMSTGGRVLHHEIDYLQDPVNTLLLVGYQAAGTLGRRLEEGAKEVEIFDRKIPVRANVKKIEGYSSHKDHEHLVQFIEQTADSLKSVYLAMGEQKARTFLAQRLRDFLGVNAVCPNEGETKKFEL